MQYGLKTLNHSSYISNLLIIVYELTCLNMSKNKAKSKCQGGNPSALGSRKKRKEKMWNRGLRRCHLSPCFWAWHWTCLSSTADCVLVRPLIIFIQKSVSWPNRTLDINLINFERAKWSFNLHYSKQENLYRSSKTYQKCAMWSQTFNKCTSKGHLTIYIQKFITIATIVSSFVAGESQPFISSTSVHPIFFISSTQFPPN